LAKRKKENIIFTAEKSEINIGNHGMEIRHRPTCWLAVHSVVWKWITIFLKLHPPRAV
jgi:hypothetical protein